MSEILVPAGDKNSALAAINAGADAIYLGLKSFSARSSAENFDEDGFDEIVGYAHSFGVKVYVAMNTLVKSSETVDFLKTAEKVWNSGADAIIVSDIFLGGYLKKNCPEIKLHLSTQAGVCNSYAAKLAKQMGFDRVILSRETALEDIKSIAKIIETEVFVQGALCTCFSGKCYLSSFAGGNSGNRGKCKQPCRKIYSIDRDGFEDKAYRLSLADLCVGEDIQKLIDAGVFSFKIEGRMRRPEYVSAAVKYYRNIIDGVPCAEDLSDLKRTYNRGNYTKGLAFGQDKNFISSAVQGHIGEFAGIIKVENAKFICQSTLKCAVGDCFKILRYGKEIGGAVFGGDCKGGFILNSKIRLKNGDKAFITTDNALNTRLLSCRRVIPVKISAEIKAGSAAVIDFNGHKICGEKAVQSALSRPLTAEDIKNCFKKTDKYPFEVSFDEIVTEGAFLAASELNALRRKVYGEFYAILTENGNAAVSVNCKLPTLINGKNTKTAAICTNLNGVVADIGILKISDFDCDTDELLSGFGGEKYLYLPPYLTDNEIEKVKPIAEKFDGIYSDGIYAFTLCDELKKPLFAGTGMNISNSADVALCDAKYVALSDELTLQEAEELATENTFYLSAGGIKVMDLIYCPFEKKCKTCDKRKTYTLTDGDGRKFTLRRYRADGCRFELYNCANLITAPSKSLGKLLDCTLEENPAELLKIYRDEEKLKKYYGNYTRGHSQSPVK